MATIVCVVCGRDHVPPRFGPKRVRYCSPACQQKAYRMRRSPEREAAAKHASNERSKRWRSANPERARELSRRWQENNRDKTRANARRFVAAHPGYARAKELRRKYGLTAVEYDAMFVSQDGRCGCCGARETSRHQSGRVRRLAVDHCHRTGRVRGLLCKDCNLGIGRFHEDVARLEAAAAYLRRVG